MLEPQTEEERMADAMIALDALSPPRAVETATAPKAEGDDPSRGATPVLPTADLDRLGVPSHWTAAECVMLARARDVCGFDPCSIAVFVPTRTCKEVLPRPWAGRVTQRLIPRPVARPLGAVATLQIYDVLKEQDRLGGTTRQGQLKAALEKESANRLRKKRRRLINREAARKRASVLKKGTDGHQAGLCRMRA